MHIGYDISQTGSGKAGCGYVAHAMIQAMLDISPQNNYSLFPSFGDFYFDTNMSLVNPYKGRSVQYGPRHLTRESAAIFWNDVDIEKHLNYPDIIQSNNYWCPIQLRASRLIFTLHDLSFFIEPAWTTESNRVGCSHGVVRSSATADWIVAVSNYSRKSYLEFFPFFPPERVRVIYNCTRFRDSSAKGDCPPALANVNPGQFWLSVGTIEPRKNQKLLAEAYARYLQAGGKRMPLVLAGGKGWLMQDFSKHLCELGIDDMVVMTGYVSDSQLIWLYRNCYANLYPSLFEGFGLPILEGMQFGAPTLTSSSTSLPEVAGDAAQLLPPDDIQAWTEAMLALAGNPAERQRLACLGKAQAARFDWNRSARALLDLYEEAIHLPKRWVQ